MKLSAGELKWLRRLAETETWPDRPFLNDTVNSIPLMRAGLVEVIDPPLKPGIAKGLPYARITPAGRRALADAEGER